MGLVCLAVPRQQQNLFERGYRGLVSRGSTHWFRDPVAKTGPRCPTFVFPPKDVDPARPQWRTISFVRHNQRTLS
jgi:hypothetical protein